MVREGTGFLDVGRQRDACGFEQRSDDTGGWGAQRHPTPGLVDLDLLQPVEIPQHVAHSGCRPARRQRVSSSLRRMRARNEQNT